MGCDKACQAKKEAEKAKKAAASATSSAKSSTPTGPVLPTVVTPTGTGTKVTTVGHVLGVHEKKNALTPFEVMALLGTASRNTQITSNPTAKSLIPVTAVAFGVYTGLLITQYAMTIAKPTVKLLVNLGGIIVNFANIGEMLTDIALLLLGIFVGLAPIFLSLLKNIFLSIPLDVGKLNNNQLEQLKALIELAKIDIKNAFNEAVSKLNALIALQEFNNKETIKGELGGYTPTTLINFTSYSTTINNYIQANSPPYSLSDILNVDTFRNALAEAFEKMMKSCKDYILETLADLLKNQSINILDIEDVSTFDVEDKNKARVVADGLLDATKRIELLQDGEVLRKQFSVSGEIPTDEGQEFDDNALAVAMANNIIYSIDNSLGIMTTKKNINVDTVFLYMVNAEIEKKKEATVGVREDIAALEFAQELIEQNKNAFIISMLNIIDDIKLDKSYISLDSCYAQQITNAFTVMKSTLYTNISTYIDNATDPVHPDTLSYIVADVCDELTDNINAYTITVDGACQTSFGNSVCESTDRFKNLLFSEIKQAIMEGTISLEKMDIPIDIDKYELNKVFNLFLDEIKKALIAQANKIIMLELVPCKSCKPCADTVADMGIYVSKSISNSKETMIRNLDAMVRNYSYDWTITGINTIAVQKAYLKSRIQAMFLRPVGELQLVDDMYFRMNLEEKELIKNVKKSLEAL